MGFLPCFAQGADVNELQLPVLGHSTTDVFDGDRPNAPTPLYMRNVRVKYDPSSASLNIATPPGTGSFLVLLQNITTGENYGYPFYVHNRVQAVPFMGGEGVWRISLASLIPRDYFIICDGYFYIDNGIIRKY